MLNDNAIDQIYNILGKWEITPENFRLFPENIINRINNQITEETTSEDFVKIAFREIYKNQNPQAQQEICWKIVQGLLDHQPVDVNTAKLFLEQIQDTSLPFYVESQSQLQKLMGSHKGGDQEKFDTYKKRMRILLKVSKEENPTQQRELEELILPFINNDKVGGNLPIELKNPEVSDTYVLSLLDYIRKLKNGEAK